MPRICPIWSKTNIKWSSANWEWQECILVEEIIQEFQGGVDASKLYEETYEPSWMKDDKEKKKRLIRLICKVKDEKYDETKEINTDIKIKIEDVKLVVKTVAGIDLNIKS
jgi:hypothetical protein